jgi:hypothetical protein
MTGARKQSTWTFDSQAAETGIALMCNCTTVALAPPRGQDQIQPSRVGEPPKIAIACEQRNPTVYAALGDQSVAETRLTPFGQNLGP